MRLTTLAKRPLKEAIVRRARCGPDSAWSRWEVRVSTDLEDVTRKPVVTVVVGLRGAAKHSGCRKLCS